MYVFYNNFDRPFEKIPLVFLFAFALWSCQEATDRDEPALIEGLPTIEQLADSLDRIDARTVKWAVNDSDIVYSKVDTVNWKKELEPFAMANVNYLRYKSAFDITDTTIGKLRYVTFRANSPKQEVQLMDMRLNGGSIDYFHIERNRENVFSKSSHSFTLEGNTYELRIHQHIPLFFENDELVVGTIITEGDLWQGELNIGERMLPFQFLLDTENTPSMTVKNGTEYIGFNEVSKTSDGWVFQSDYFNSRFEFSFENDSTVRGNWINAKRDNNHELEFVGRKGVPYRFAADKLPGQNLTGQQLAIFYDKDGNPDDSTLLVLRQTAQKLSGSFLTETGDYRFLDGVVRNDSIFLSSLDGTHAFLFEGVVENGAIEGVFYSGKTWRQSWSSMPDPENVLSDPESMTFIKDDSVFSFSFPGTNGELVSLDDEAFDGKVIAVSLMGTWCSNCMDEALFLREAHAQYASKGFEVVALDFELTNDSSMAMQNIERHRKSLGISYPVLLASLGSSKKKAAELLPSLSGFYSYPTLIILDRNHNVVKIHTGFTGPAAGRMHYEMFRQKYLQLIDSLVRQPA